MTGFIKTDACKFCCTCYDFALVLQAHIYSLHRNVVLMFATERCVQDGESGMIFCTKILCKLTCGSVAKGRGGYYKDAHCDGHDCNCTVCFNE